MRQAVDTSQGPEGSLWSSLLSPTLTATAGDTEEPGRHPPAWPPCGSEPGTGSVGGCDERLCRLAAGRARSGGHTVSPDRPCPAVPGSGCCRSLASGRGPSSASCPRGAGLGVPAWSVETLGHGQHISICAEPDAGGANGGWGGELGDPHVLAATATVSRGPERLEEAALPRQLGPSLREE